MVTLRQVREDQGVVTLGNAGSATRAGRGRLRERGQVAVLFALLLPMILVLGSIVISVGNWYVHKRHLQTQVDAAAFAGATFFVGCFDDATNTNPAIRDAALEYAGDMNRDPATYNTQVQEPTDVHVVLNSTVYWTGNPSPVDNTLDSADSDLLGDPCNERYLDVKATDDKLPLLWGGLSLAPSAKAHARIEIQKIEGLSGMLPFAIPEIDPKAVAVLFVDEEAPATAPILGQRELQPPLFPPAGLTEFGIWDSPQPAQTLGIGDGAVQDDRAKIGVVVLVSEKLNPVVAGSLDSICNQDPVNVKCYGYRTNPTPTSGLYYIGGYAGQGVLRQVRLQNLTCGADNKSAPWFLRAGSCEATIKAVVAFPGVTGDPTGVPTRGCVTSSPGGSMDWSPGGLDATLGTWTYNGSVTLPEAGTQQAGRQSFNISYGKRGGSGPGGSCGVIETFSGVAHPYVANADSGPIEYVQVSAGVNPADSVGFGPNDFSVRVGLSRPLKATPKLDPPILLRFKKGGGSLTQAVNCDVDNVVYPGPFKPGFDLNSMNKDAAEMAYGCVTQYNKNGPGPCPFEYDTVAELPPTTTTPSPIPTCAEGRPGQVASMRTGLDYRFEQPCTPNYWPTNASQPYPPPTDPRYVILLITDFGGFDQNNERVVKVRRFAGFYVTGWDISGSGGDTQGCFDPDMAGPLKGNDLHPIFPNGCPTGSPNNPTCDDGDVWGHFVTFVVPTPAATTNDELCNFNELDICIAVLVE